MARIRSIHPGLFTDEAYMSLGFPARELLKGIWCEADDKGVFEWKPLTLKARILPADNIDINELLEELIAHRFLKRFEVNGHQYGAVRNFCRFQRPKKPKEQHPRPADIRAWVGDLDGTESEPVPDDDETGSEPVPHQSPTSGENPPQIGGWRMEDGGCSSVGDESPTAAKAALERQVFDVGKRVLGKKSGALIQRLRKAVADDQATLRLLNEAAEKQDPAEWVARVIRNRDGPILPKTPKQIRDEILAEFGHMRDW